MSASRRAAAALLARSRALLGEESRFDFVVIVARSIGGGFFVATLAPPFPSFPLRLRVFRHQARFLAASPTSKREE